MPTQTRVSHDPKRDFLEDTPTTYVPSLPSDVDRVLEQIDRVLNREDVLPADRTALTEVPEPIPMLGTALASLAATLSPTIEAIKMAQLPLATALAPTIEKIREVQSSFSMAVAPTIDVIGAAQLSLADQIPQLPATAAHVVPANDPSPSVVHLERCLRELQDWLGIGLGDATRAAGIDRGTVYAWRRRGSDARPGTAGAILRLHSIVASVVAVVGVERAREWFHAGEPSPLTRLLDASGDSSSMSAVAAEARRALTGRALPPPSPLLGQTVGDRPARPLT